MLTRIMVSVILGPFFLFSFALAKASPATIGRLGRGLGRALRAVHFRKKVVTANLELAFGSSLTLAEREALARRVYAHTGTLFLEIARNFSLTPEQSSRELEISEADLATARRITGAGKGAVYITGHIGNWEHFASGMAAKGLPVTLVVKQMNDPVSQVMIERHRKRTGLEIIYSGRTLEKMAAALSRGRAIGFMVDQNTTGKKGIRTNFFGVPASSIRGLAKLAKETGTPIVPICAYRLPSGNHRVQLWEPLPYQEAKNLPEPERALREEWLNSQQYQTAIEEMIRLHPDQWLWIHRRWKADRRPLQAETAHLENSI